MNHTEQCSKALESNTAAREAYRRQWPNHCTTGSVYRELGVY